MRSIEEILDEVCWNHGYINFQGLQGNLRHPTATGHKELFSIIEETAKSYSRDSERYYDTNIELQDKVEYLQDRVKELEDKLNELRED